MTQAGGQKSLGSKHTTVYMLGWAVVSMVLFYAGAPAFAQVAKATGTIQGCSDPAIAGTVKLRELTSGQGVREVEVRVKVKGLPDGLHGVHIHEVGKCSPCGDAGGHFDPGPEGNSSPDGNHPFHSGDLVNINVRKGKGKLETVTSRITIAPGPLSIFDTDGSALIIHTSPDTFCPNGSTAGCAGGTRAACAVLTPAQ